MHLIIIFNGHFVIYALSMWKLKKPLKKLPEVSWKPETARKKTAEERINKLQEWIDKYLSDEERKRCLNAVRQRQFNKSHRRLTLKLTKEIYWDLGSCAKKLGLTLEETVDKLVQKELTRLRGKD